MIWSLCCSFFWISSNTNYFQLKVSLSSSTRLWKTWLSEWWKKRSSYLSIDSVRVFFLSFKIFIFLWSINFFYSLFRFWLSRIPYKSMSFFKHRYVWSFPFSISSSKCRWMNVSYAKLRSIWYLRSSFMNRNPWQMFLSLLWLLKSVYISSTGKPIYFLFISSPTVSSPNFFSSCK